VEKESDANIHQLDLSKEKKILNERNDEIHRLVSLKKKKKANEMTVHFFLSIYIYAYFLQELSPCTSTTRIHEEKNMQTKK
jgi:hypothetical protein